MDCNRYCLAAMAVGFATALGAAVPALSGDFAKDVFPYINRRLNNRKHIWC